MLAIGAVLGYNQCGADPSLLRAVFERICPRAYSKEMIGMARRIYTRRSLADRFWEKVDKKGPDECWEWTASKFENGYGQIDTGGKDGKNMKAHRVAWMLTNGPIPEGKCVLHTCDNPGCVNPSHLFTGSNADNSYDMMQKNRQARGVANARSKITKQQASIVPILLALGYTQAYIARSFGVRRQSIWSIAHGKNWGWLK